MFHPPVKRSLLATAASVGVSAALIPAAVSAQTVELGVTKSPVVAPVCPKTVSAANCKIILTRSTALQSIRDASDYPTTAKSAGVIDAFTIGLSRLSGRLGRAKSYVHYLDHTYGGTAQAAIAVLKPIGDKQLRHWQVVAESPLFHLQPYLGTVTQFPLANALGVPGAPPMAAPLPIAKGDAVALSVPTWAPVLTFGLKPSDFAYRQSRRLKCQTTASSEQAQLTLNATATYGCNYTGTRVEYSATEVTTPSAPGAQVHAPRSRART